MCRSTRKTRVTFYSMIAYSVWVARWELGNWTARLLWLHLDIRCYAKWAKFRGTTLWTFLNAWNIGCCIFYFLRMKYAEVMHDSTYISRVTQCATVKKDRRALLSFSTIIAVYSDEFKDSRKFSVWPEFTCFCYWNRLLQKARSNEM